MPHEKRFFLIASGLLLAAAPAFSATADIAKPDLANAPAHLAQRHLALQHGKLHRPKRPLVPLEASGWVDLDTEPHFAVSIGKGNMAVLSMSKGFDPDELRTAASHTKLLTAACALDAFDANPSLKAVNWRLLYRALIFSDNKAAAELALNVASVPTEDGVRAMLKDKAAQLGLSPGFEAKNANGYPNLPNGRRADSLASPRDIVKIAAYLATVHAPAMRDLYRSVGESPEIGKPTNNIFFPLPLRNEPMDSNVQLWCKTATDENQNHSTVSVFSMPDKIIVIFHPHLPSPRVRKAPLPSDPRDPIATAAALASEVLSRAGVKEPLLMEDLRKTAFGLVRPGDIGGGSLETLQLAKAETLGRQPPATLPGNHRRLGKAPRGQVHLQKVSFQIN